MICLWTGCCGSRVMEDTVHWHHKIQLIDEENFFKWRKRRITSVKGNAAIQKQVFSVYFAKRMVGKMGSWWHGLKCDPQCTLQAGTARWTEKLRSQSSPSSHTCRVTWLSSSAEMGSFFYLNKRLSSEMSPSSQTAQIIDFYPHCSFEKHSLWQRSSTPKQGEHSEVTEEGCGQVKVFEICLTDSDTGWSLDETWNKNSLFCC